MISLTPVTVPISLISVPLSHIPSSTTDSGLKVSPSSYTTQTAIQSSNPTSAQTSPPIPNTLSSSVSQSFVQSNIARNPAPYHATESSYFGGLSQFDTRTPQNNASPFPEFRVPVNYYSKSTQPEPGRLDRNGFFKVPDFEIPTVPQNIERPPMIHPQYSNQSNLLVGPYTYQSNLNIGTSVQHPQYNNYGGSRYPDNKVPKSILNTTNVGPRQPYDRVKYIPPTLAHSPYLNRAFNQTIARQWASSMMPIEASHVRNTRQKIPIALPPIQIPHSFVPIPLPRRMNTHADLVRNRELHHNKYKGILMKCWHESRVKLRILHRI